jgi:putative oxidoreductase
MQLNEREKRISYGGVLILHSISTLSSYRQYLDPFNNLLFFAAWPMLAACVALYLLRDVDTKWTVGASARGKRLAAM